MFLHSNSPLKFESDRAVYCAYSTFSNVSAIFDGETKAPNLSIFYAPDEYLDQSKNQTERAVEYDERNKFASIYLWFNFVSV